MKHSHYKKPVAGLEFIDVYRVLVLFGVTDPCLQHAVKKLLVAGGRGAKDIGQDIQEAIDTLQRWQEMRAEDELAGKVSDAWDRLIGKRAPEDFGQQNMLEPASEIDDDSERMQAIGQNGNDGAAYLAGNIERHPECPRHQYIACGLGHSTHACTGGES